MWGGTNATHLWDCVKAINAAMVAKDLILKLFALFSKTQWKEFMV
jgi:hypothetical protein